MKTETENLVLPIVHLNGTSKSQLLDDREAVYYALGQAYDALKQMGPNGRDYYPIPGRMELAIEQHRRRLAAIDAIRNEIGAECVAISEL